MLAVLIREKRKFADAEFPHGKTSLIKDWTDPVVARIIPEWEKYEWLRCTMFLGEIYSSRVPEVFEGGIEPDDVVQGDLANCYFLTVLMAMSESPDLIKRLFLID